ncbi:MAG: winged helix-turn-helix domain-containing protein [Candidatus Nitrosopolaris sp.]|jgi:predicted transcriptional regulator|nr:winged helix-turn-helix domain-containing protein [Candidatus Bathyarchaeia archaeon]
MRQEKRHKLQLHYEILVAIEGHMSNNDERAARPTHIQHTSRLSYDKMMNHFNELEAKGMILYRRTNTDGLISITNKGKQFIKQYNELMILIESAGL